MGKKSSESIIMESIYGSTAGHMPSLEQNSTQREKRFDASSSQLGFLPPLAPFALRFRVHNIMSWLREMAKQADLQELAQTALVAVVFGFMLSKLVSMIATIRSSMKSGGLRLERESSGQEEQQSRGGDQNLSSSDDGESIHSADSDGDGADISGLSEGRADYSEVSESGGIEESPGAPAPTLHKNEHEPAAAAQSLAPPGELSEAGYEPSTSSSGEAEERPGAEDEAGEEDDSSDWEGVESTELDETFGAASSYVATMASGLKVPNDVQLQLYGLYKVATEGPCHTPQPSALKLTARAKWNAWQKLGSISQEEAMERYVEVVCGISPDWSQAIQNKKRKGGEGTSGIDPNKGRVGPVFSSLNYDDKSDEGTLEALHIAAREGNEAGVVELLDGGVPVDIRDSDSRTPLHWASDRGHLKLVELLLSRGADIEAKDKEGQTSLHYASICEQEEVSKVLVRCGADPSSRDGEGGTPLSLCPSSWSSWMMMMVSSDP